MTIPITRGHATMALMIQRWPPGRYGAGLYPMICSKHDGNHRIVPRKGRWTHNPTLWVKQTMAEVEK